MFWLAIQIVIQENNDSRPIMPPYLLTWSFIFINIFCDEIDYNSQNFHQDILVMYALYQYPGPLFTDPDYVLLSHEQVITFQSFDLWDVYTHPCTYSRNPL